MSKKLFVVLFVVIAFVLIATLMLLPNSPISTIHAKPYLVFEETKEASGQDIYDKVGYVSLILVNPTDRYYDNLHTIMRYDGNSYGNTMFSQVDPHSNVTKTITFDPVSSHVLNVTISETNLGDVIDGQILNIEPLAFRLKATVQTTLVPAPRTYRIYVEVTNTYSKPLKLIQLNLYDYALNQKWEFACEKITQLNVTLSTQQTMNATLDLWDYMARPMTIDESRPRIDGFLNFTRAECIAW